MGSAAEQSEHRTRRALGDRSLCWLLVVLLVAAPLLWHAGRACGSTWTSGTSSYGTTCARPGTLLDGWFGHNVALPAAAYRVLIALWGVSSYRPYLALAIAGHYAVVLAVWALARRLGVHRLGRRRHGAPVHLLRRRVDQHPLGVPGHELAALAFGLFTSCSRTATGRGRGPTPPACCAAAALACSGIGVASTVGVGAAVLIRRGPGPAALHTVPIGLAWSVWHLAGPEPGLEASTRLNDGPCELPVVAAPRGPSGVGWVGAAAFALGALAVLGVVSGPSARARTRRPRRRTARRDRLVGCAAMRWPSPCSWRSSASRGQASGGRPRPLPLRGRRPHPAAGRARRRGRRPPPSTPRGRAAVARGRGERRRTASGRSPSSNPSPTGKVSSRIANSDLLATAPSRELPVIFGVATADEFRVLAALPGLPGDEGVGRDLQLRADLVLGLHPGQPDHEARCRSLGAGPQQLDPGDTIDFVGDVTLTAVDGADRSPVAFSGRQRARS